MFPYDLPGLPGSGPPRRWDVVVFRYPEEPEVSYIKRLVGLPGETIRVAHGDIYVKPPGGTDFYLARKPLRHQSAMQIMVYDDRYRPKAFADMPQWARWRGAAGWKTPSPSESRYLAETGGEGWSELRYNHLVPDPEQWAAVVEGRDLPREPRSTLITDFYSYNTNLTAPPRDAFGSVQDGYSAWMQSDWVGDLTLESVIDVKRVNPGGSLRWELIKAGVPHHCTVDLTTGQAIFTRGEEVLGKGQTAIKGPGRHRVEFGNVDDRMTLVVDGRPVGDPGFAYETGEANPIPTAADLTPAAMAVRNATVEASDLVLKRDIYYTQKPGEHDYELVWDERQPTNPAELFEFLSDPARFPKLGRLRYRDFEVSPDRFFMLGDNSPCSSDSRRWGSRDSAWDESGGRRSWEVPRQYLTGKAFYVYWPHGVPFWPEIFRLGRDFRFPFRPYFERMKWIR
jgi:signal peptidase I